MGVRRGRGGGREREREREREGKGEGVGKDWEEDSGCSGTMCDLVMAVVMVY